MKKTYPSLLFMLLWLLIAPMASYAQMLELFNTRPGASTNNPVDSVKILLQARGWLFQYMDTYRNGISPIEGNGSLISQNLSGIIQVTGFTTPFLRVQNSDSFRMSFTIKFHGAVSNKWFKISLLDTLGITALKDSLFIASAPAHTNLRYAKWIKGYSRNQNYRIQFTTTGNGSNRLVIDSVGFNVNLLYPNGGINVAPVGKTDTFRMLKNTTLQKNVLLNDKDVNGDSIILGNLTSSPVGGTFSINGAGEFTYTPPIGFVGIKSFTYIPRDRGYMPLSGNVTNVVIIVHNPSSLPVKLLSLSGKKVEAGNLIEWATAAEIDNDYFDVERSSDGKNFEAIARVKGNGNTNEIMNYSFVDSKPLAGMNYYRLHQVDFDGKWENTHVIAVENNYELSAMVHVFPNPSVGNAPIRIAGLEAGVAEVFNSNGHLVAVQDFNAQQPLQPAQWTNACAGMYIICVKGASAKETFTLRLLIQ